MAIVGRVAACEWKMLRSDAAQRAAAVVFGAVLVVAMLLGLARTRAEEASTAWLEARDAEQRAVLAAGASASSGSPGETPPAWGPAHADYVANDRGTYAVLPPPALLALAVGQTDIYPNHYRITARLRESVMTGDQIANPLWLLTGHLDLSFVVLYLYPLLILALTFDLTASEQRSGTLRMLLAQPVGLTAVLGGKLLIRAAVLLVPVLLVPAVTVAAAGADPDAVVRLTLWTLTAVAYGGFWFGLALVVNAYGRTAAMNALTLAGAWMAAVVVIPAAVNLATTAVYPVPSRVEFANAARVATREAVVQGSQLLGHFMEDHPVVTGIGQEGMQEFAALQAARDEEVARRLEPVLARYEERLARQRAFVHRLRYLSPTILAHAAMLDAAGTSGVRHRHFAGEAARFQADWKAFFDPYLLRVAPLAAADYERLPRFVYREEPLGSVAARSVTPVAVLLLAGAALGAYGVRAYRGYDLTG